MDVKRRIGAKGKRQNIPDGYLIDLSSSRPKLFVVENEIQAHDPLSHIAVQILQFSLSFESSQQLVKEILLEALNHNDDAKRLCVNYAQANSFRNLDHLLETLVYHTPFSALVIIDEASEELESVLSEKFRFAVEVLEISQYSDASGKMAYAFEPFLAGVGISESADTWTPAAAPYSVDWSKIDTVVVPANEEGFQRVFLGENRWHEIRMDGVMRPQIKYIAAYQNAPYSAITHIAPVSSIEQWKDTHKLVLNFSAPAQQIGPIRWQTPGRGKGLQGPRYATRENIEKAKFLEDLWPGAKVASGSA